MGWVSIIFLAGGFVVGSIATGYDGFGLSGLLIIVGIMFGIAALTNRKKKSAPVDDGINRIMRTGVPEPAAVRTGPDPTRQDPAYCDKCGSKL